MQGNMGGRTPSRQQFLGEVKNQVERGKNAADTLGDKLSEAMDFFETLKAHEPEGKLGRATMYGVFLSKCMVDVIRMFKVTVASYDTQIEALKTALDEMEALVAPELRHRIDLVRQKLADALAGEAAEEPKAEGAESAS